MPTELTLRAVLLSPLGSFTRAGDNVPGHGAAHDSGLRVKVTHDRPTVWAVLWGLDEATRSKAQDLHLLGKSSQQKGVKIRFLPQHLAWKTPNILQCHRPQLP